MGRRDSSIGYDNIWLIRNRCSEVSYVFPFDWRAESDFIVSFACLGCQKRKKNWWQFYF